MSVIYTKNYTFAKIQDGDGRHLRFWIFAHILVINEDICFKFVTPTEIDHIWVTVAPKAILSKFKMTAAAISIFDYLAISRSLMKILALNLVL